MPSLLASHPAALRLYERVRRAAPALFEDAAFDARVQRVALASDLALETLARQPQLLDALSRDDHAEPDAPGLTSDNRADWPALLRRYRTAVSTCMVWRDVLGHDDAADTIGASTRLAETCLRIALDALEHDFETRHGVVRAPDGTRARLVVFGLGKLGGGELNFSSDVDLVYAYEHEGESDVSQHPGARVLAAETYFARLGQQLAKLLDEATADGFCHRVDLRLRPYGNAGRVAWSFTAMEQYFQREGRDWERYAWQKARPVAGDIDAGERFLQVLRPFVYRRYLDFGALDGLRTMKAAIAAEVARKDLADDIKRGPGGIREVEFLVQALQLIRGGREPALRQRSLLLALQALVDAGHVQPDAAQALREAYLFLRRLENRLQMLRDAQTHALPAVADDRVRLATALGHADWDALVGALELQRAQVSVEFDALLAVRRSDTAPDALSTYWHGLPDAGDVDALDAAGFMPAADADTALRDFARSPGVRALSDTARARLDRVMPVLLQGAAQSREPVLALRRLLALLHNILSRSAYLALLDEQPAALARLVEAVSRSALLAERLAQHPLLLDELLDARVAGAAATRESLHAAVDAVDTGDDVEAALQALNEVRQALGFRIALAFRDGRQNGVASARQLAWLAEAVVRRVLQLAEADLERAHGRVPGARFAVLGYGSLGGEELGFGSDLDLVFLYDAASDSHSNGARSLDAARWHMRLAQKLVALLGAVTAAGRLFDVDVRLRPDGAKGLLVSSLASFSDYQRERAWTWEHQALVRARCIAGDATLCAQFDVVRADTLARTRDPAAVCTEVSDMRRRLRAELDRSDATVFDLKQGLHGLVDLEFALQAMVLSHAHACDVLLRPRATPDLLDALEACGLVDAQLTQALRNAHGALLARGLDCTLDRRARRVAYEEKVQRARTAIDAWCRALGLRFERGA